MTKVEMLEELTTTASTVTVGERVVDGVKSRTSISNTQQLLEYSALDNGTQHGGVCCELHLRPNSVLGPCSCWSVVTKGSPTDVLSVDTVERRSDHKTENLVPPLWGVCTTSRRDPRHAPREAFSLFGLCKNSCFDLDELKVDSSGVSDNLVLIGDVAVPAITTDKETPVGGESSNPSSAKNLISLVTSAVIAALEDRGAFHEKSSSVTKLSHIRTHHHQIECNSTTLSQCSVYDDDRDVASDTDSRSTADDNGGNGGTNWPLFTVPSRHRQLSGQSLHLKLRPNLDWSAQSIKEQKVLSHQRAAKIIHNLVIDVSTALTLDDKARIRAKFEGPSATLRSTRSLSIAARLTRLHVPQEYRCSSDNRLPDFCKEVTPSH